MEPEQPDCALLPNRFLALFPQRFGSTFRTIGSTTWREMSQFHYLEDDSIMASLGGSSKNIRAFLMDKTTKFLVLSCPTGDDGIEFDVVRLVVKQLRDIGLKPNLYRESGSNSIQIFLAFSELVETDRIAKIIASFLRNTTLIVHDTNTPFVLPLQKDFAWLNNDFSMKVECDHLAIEAAMAMFLHDLDSNSVFSEVLETLAKAAMNNEETQCSTEFSDCDVIEPIEKKIQQPVAEETFKDLPEVAPDIDIQELAMTNFRPVELLDANTEVQVPGGQQLLLFPVELQNSQFELPKEITKHKKRARSDLPSDAQSKALLASFSS